jgi:DNA processing protein
MTTSNKTIAKAVALTEISGIADSRAKKLIQDFGSPEAVYDASLAEFSEYHYIDESTYDALQSHEATIRQILSELNRCRQNGIDLIPIFDEQYPDRLKAVSGPLLLYAQGNTALLSRDNSVGFTGTREASEEAIDWTQTVAAELAAEDRVIISGGATGIDTAAHSGALDAAGETISILGTGINVPFPEENEQLFERIVDNNGLLLAQRRIDAGPSRSGFLNRNATLTGLSHAVIVVATDGSGGTMSTYSDAKSQERLIFCPDPELELEPVAGIKQIAAEEAIPIRRYEEVLANQDCEKSSTAINNTNNVSPDTGSGQSSIDDFS